MELWTPLFFSLLLILAEMVKASSVLFSKKRELISVSAT